jgi:hypothetical protein
MVSIFEAKNYPTSSSYDDNEDDYDESSEHYNTSLSKGKGGGFDAIESALLKEEMKYSKSSGGSSSSSYDLDRKINLSQKIQNDITRSEKKGDKRVSNSDKNDRATSEQVLDPRTRLILFKLLNSGFLEEIDGNIFFANSHSSFQYLSLLLSVSLFWFLSFSCLLCF